VADYLRDGVYELRPTTQGVHYRVLYGFHGREAVVVSHGTIKTQRVGDREIDLAAERIRRYRRDPIEHGYEGDQDAGRVGE
jgi:phage-related protein